MKGIAVMIGGNLLVISGFILAAFAQETGLDLLGVSVLQSGDAADGLQDGMIAAFRRAGSFRGEAAVTTWLHRIVLNTALMRLRRKEPERVRLGAGRCRQRKREGRRGEQGALQNFTPPVRPNVARPGRPKPADAANPADNPQRPGDLPVISKRPPRQIDVDNPFGSQ